MRTPSSYIFITLGLSLFTFFASGQSLSKYEKQALKACEKGDYITALNHYEVLLNQEHRPDLLFKAGQIAQQLEAYYLAANYFGRIAKEEQSGALADATYHQALALKALGRYEEAIAAFEEYQKNKEGVYHEIAAKELANCRWALGQELHPVKLDVVNAGLNVNTENDDFAPLRYAGKLYFSSRPAGGKSAPAERIYSAILDFPAQTSDANPAGKEGGAINTALTADAQRMYFSLCEKTPDGASSPCKIYVRMKNFDGQWERPKILPSVINYQNYTATQPGIGYDRTLRKEVLYFVTNRPGGMGALDIWGSVIERDGSYGEPFPLPINTPLDDVTPYFHQASQTLFFSTEGRESMGGFDIFRSKKTGPQTWSEPENLGYPLNSSFDEQYFTFHTRTKSGYFSSNRPGGVNDGTHIGTLPSDIYRAQMYVELNPRFVNALDSMALCDVRIELADLTLGGTRTFYINANCEDYLIPLDLERVYSMSVSSKDYLPAVIRLNTLGISFSTVLQQVIPLMPESTADVNAAKVVVKKP
ncbi:MAG: tetratricopeptide repeat protein [Saprospiraceae bacterium]|nr:MAG: tetratricopeptide repeat protein [Saprospiraceae bacterium]